MNTAQRYALPKGWVSMKRNDTYLKIASKLPSALRRILEDNDQHYADFLQYWKMSDTSLKQVISCIHETIRPIFVWRLAHSHLVHGYFTTPMDSGAQDTLRRIMSGDTPDLMLPNGERLAIEGIHIEFVVRGAASTRKKLPLSHVVFNNGEDPALVSGSK